MKQSNVVEVQQSLSFWQTIEYWCLVPRLSRIKYVGLNCFWFFTLFLLCMLFIPGFPQSEKITTLEGSYDYLGVATLILVAPNFLALNIRRFHDINRSALWLILGLIPYIGQLILIIMCIWPGTKGRNKFGDQPEPTRKRYYFMISLFPITVLMYSIFSK